MKNCLRGLEVLEPEFQLPKCSQHVTHCRIRRFVQHDGCISCLQKIESMYPRFGLQDIDCDLGCLIYAYIRDSCKSMKNCRDSAFNLRGLEAGL